MPGLAKDIVDAIPWQTIAQRTRRDIATDFIFAPHYNSIFAQAEAELTDLARRHLGSGQYQPELPLTVPIPKRWGFTRPGSILNPLDRVIYHALGETVAPQIEDNLDRERVFSHVWIPPSSAETTLFEPDGPCWSRLRQQITKLGRRGGYFLKADVANYFERIPQHHVVNLLRAVGCNSSIVNLLEEMLLAFRERDSFGILQGLFTSDLLGNFYLSSVDSYFDIEGSASARFVDDIYVHYKSRDAAARGLIYLIETLRKDGLHVNEAKSGVFTAKRTLAEENELDRLFEDAAKEIREEQSRTPTSRRLIKNSGVGGLSMAITSS